MQKNLAFLLGLGLLCLAAFLFLSSPQPETEVAGASEPPANTDSSTQTFGGAEAPAVTNTVVERTVEQGSSGIGSSTFGPDPATITDTIRIRILEAKSESPIAGAEIWTFSGKRIREAKGEERDFLRTQLDPEVRGRRISETYRSDEEGYVEIPIYEHGQQIAARKGELFGYEQYFGRRNRELHLSPDLSTSIRVVDHLGNALEGVPIGLATRTQGGLPPIRDSARLSGKDGVVKLEHLQLWWDPEEEKDIRILPHVLLKEEISLSLMDWLNGSLTGEINMPRLGSLEIQIQDWNGEPTHSPFRILLVQDPHPDVPVEEKVEGFWYTPALPLREVSQGDRILFRHIGLGLDLAAIVSGEDFQVDPIASGPGPWQEGTTATLIAKPNREPAHYRMRLVAADGNPLPKQKLQLVTQRARSQSWEDGDYYTDADGYFDYYPDLDRVDKLHDGKTEFRLRSLGDEELLPMEGTVTMPARLDGFQDLGVIPMTMDDLLVSGMVVDEEGEPIQGVTFWARMVVGDKRENEHGKTDAMGRFHVFRSYEGEEVSMEFEGPNLVAQRLPIPVGTSGLRVVMQEGRILKGQVLFSPGFRAKSFRIQFLQGGKPYSSRGWLREDGSFELQGLPPITGVFRRHQQQSTHRVLDCRWRVPQHPRRRSGSQDSRDRSA